MIEHTPTAAQEVRYSMTNRDLVRLAKRVERWQHILSPLGVAHFRIEQVSAVDETPAGPHSNVTVQIFTHYDSVKFWFTHEFLEGADEKGLDEAIIHEWVHVAMRDFDNALEAVEPWMPLHTYRDFEESVDHEREGLVDRVARCIWELYHVTE